MASDMLLVADTSASIQKVVQLTCRAAGLRVVAVADGRQARAAVEAERPAAVLVDVSLPADGGYGVAAFIREQTGGEVPVLLLAGAFDTIDEDRLRECGSAGVLTKPFTPQELLDSLRSLNGPSGTPLVPADAGLTAGALDRTDDELTRIGAALSGRGKPPVPAAGTRTEEAVPTLGGVLGESGPAPGVPDALPEEALDRLARRVAERLAPSAVEPLVARIVTEVAERLVREEIARIKSGE